MTNNEFMTKIKERAYFLSVVKYNGSVELEECVCEAVEEVTHLSHSQLCSLFEVLMKDTNYKDFVKMVVEEMKNEE